MKNPLLFAALLLALLHTACQYPVDSAQLPALKKFVVIDADISEQGGQLRVAYSFDEVDASGSYRFPTDPVVTDAHITDSQGQRTDFLSDGTLGGAFQGRVGETYTLRLQVDGVPYESKAETMRPCPAIDSLRPVFTEESFRDPSNYAYYGFDVYAYLRDSASAENYYQWSWVHYERALSCERRYDPAERREVLIPCIPYNCWNISYSREVVVQSDALRDGQPIAQKIVRVPFVNPPLKYYLRVEQRSITPTVYAYLQSIATQTQNSGTLYDTPPQTRFSPNIVNLDEPSAPVLGVFNVFSNRHKLIYLDRLHAVNGIQPRSIPEVIPYTIDPFAYSPCVESYSRTQVKPLGWED